MRIPEILQDNIDERFRDEFRRSLALDNIRRGKILAVVVIAFESVYSAADIIAALLNVDGRFRYYGYLAMYLAMILTNVLYLLFLKWQEKNRNSADLHLRRFDIVFLAYITLVMSWGSVITLMDQKLYGQIVAFIVSTIICSVVYVLDNRKILIPYSVSVLILALGLPFFQPSKDILIGHYVNLLVFIFISWLASRIIYHSYCRNFVSRVMLGESNKQLENEIEENRKITLQLALANNQLRELTLLDDLTGIPNRRSFRDFIDRAFETTVNEDSTLSIIMIDIDFFKQFNDCYGHEEGDTALIRIAGLLKSVVESPDEFAVRWGGEEFIYAAFNLGMEAISAKAEAIVEKVSALNIRHHVSTISDRITISVGASTIRISGKKEVNLAVKLADKALYIAKSSGRNCVKTLCREQRD
jgi:diguanylate cyclase (GGDEF)-like protein